MSTGLAFRRWMLIAVVIVAACASCASGAAIVALNPHDRYSFYLRGQATLDVGTGSVQVNSNSSAAAFFQGSDITFTAGEVRIVGGGFLTQGSPSLEMDIYLSEPYVPDPLAGLPVPDVGAPVGPPKIAGSGTFQPGYYPQGLDLVAGNNVTLMPGVYVLDNGFHLNGSATLHGQGVMFYIRSGAILDNGTGPTFLAPPADGVYRGITFFQARDNTNPALFNRTGSFTGFGDAAGAGTLYLPASTLEFGGTGDMYVNGIVADKVVAYGSGLTKVIVPEPACATLLVVGCAGLLKRTRRVDHV